MSEGENQSGIVIEVKIKFPGVDKPFEGIITADKALAERLVAVYKDMDDPVQELGDLASGGAIACIISDAFSPY